MANVADIQSAIDKFIINNSDEIKDIGIVEGAGLAARMMSRGLPQTRAISAGMSGLASYQNELAKTQNMNPLERYSRAGLIGLTDGIYDLVPLGNMFKGVTQKALQYAGTGLARLGSDIVNNRAMESLNDSIWGYR